MSNYIREDKYNEEITKEISSKFESIIKNLGEDPKREGLLKTPERVAKSLQFLTQGYDQNPSEILNGALFNEDTQDMVIVKDIELFSMCEHHILPFFGKVHIAYVPNGKIVGLSKLPRIVDAFSRRLQVQERLTSDIKNCIQDTLNPNGVAVVIEANHMCMQMRGVQKQNSFTTTTSYTGVFNDLETRKEFLSLIK